MLTIFTIPKPFQGHIAVIQRNAIKSWLLLQPTCEVILCGDDPGTAETAQEFGVKHIQDIAINDYGTPLLDDAFNRVQQIARNRFICYANADIIFFSDLMSALTLLPMSQFLMVGQRWDIDIIAPIDFDKPDWEQRFKIHLAHHGKLQRIDYIDYFVFPKNTIGDLPKFAVGRPGWDNWMIYSARRLQIPVVDATQFVTAAHQNHDYTHIPEGTGALWEGPEADRNRALAGGKRHRFYVTDATHKLTERGVSKAIDDQYLERRASAQSRLDERTAFPVQFQHRLVTAIGRRRKRFPGWLWRFLIDRLTR